MSAISGGAYQTWTTPPNKTRDRISRLTDEVGQMAWRKPRATMNINELCCRFLCEHLGTLTVNLCSFQRAVIVISVIVSHVPQCSAQRVIYIQIRQYKLWAYEWTYCQVKSRIHHCKEVTSHLWASFSDSSLWMDISGENLCEMTWHKTGLHSSLLSTSSMLIRQSFFCCQDICTENSELAIGVWKSPLHVLQGSDWGCFNPYSTTQKTLPAYRKGLLTLPTLLLADAAHMTIRPDLMWLYLNWYREMPNCCLFIWKCDLKIGICTRISRSSISKCVVLTRDPGWLVG